MDASTDKRSLIRRLMDPHSAVRTRLSDGAIIFLMVVVFLLGLLGVPVGVAIAAYVWPDTVGQILHAVALFLGMTILWVLIVAFGLILGCVAVFVIIATMPDEYDDPM